MEGRAVDFSAVADEGVEDLPELDAQQLGHVELGARQEETLGELGVPGPRASLRC